MRNPKSETRNPKEAPKSKAQRYARLAGLGLGLGLGISFGFLVSDFGFPPGGAV